MEIKKLIDYWPIVVGLVTTTAAVGAGFQKIDTIEKAINKQVENQQSIQRIETKQAAAEARQELILEQVKAQRVLLEQMLLDMRSGE